MTDDERKIDEMADFHARLSKLETERVAMSRRITSLENGHQGRYSDDPMGSLFSPSLMWAVAILTLAPLIIDVVKQWKSSPSLQS